MKDETPCECEHEAHFGELGDGHPYGTPCDDPVTVRTEWGTFAVCASCAREHHGQE